MKTTAFILCVVLLSLHVTNIASNPPNTGNSDATATNKNSNSATQGQSTNVTNVVEPADSNSDESCDNFFDFNIRKISDTQNVGNRSMQETQKVRNTKC